MPVAARPIDRPPPPRRPRPSAPRRFPAEGVALFAVAFALRGAYAWLANGPAATPSSDPATYDAVAWNLARGLGFSLGEGAGAWPTAFVPPLVPWLASLVYRVAGHQYVAAVLAQCAIGALAPLLARALGANLYGSPVGRLAGWLVACDPLLVFFSAYLLTETTFAVTLLLAMLATVLWIKTPRAGRALGAGLLWGLATLTRPTALLLPPLLALWAWAPLGLLVAPRERAKQLALLGLGLALVVAPWTLRNAAALGAFVPVTTGQGRALLDSNNPIAWNDPALRGNAITVYQREPYASEFRGRSEVEVDRRATALALAFLRENAARFPEAALAKVSRLWRVSREGGTTGAWLPEGSALAPLARLLDPLLLWSVPLFALALAGLVATWRGARRLFQSVALVPVVYFTLLATVYWGALRVRVPFEPLVALYAAVGLDWLLRLRRVRASGFSVIEGRAGPPAPER